MDLHPHEIKLLDVLKNFQKGADVTTLSKASGLNPDSVRKAALWAASKGLVRSETETRKIYLLTTEGREWLDKKTLPELELCKEISSGARKISEPA